MKFLLIDTNGYQFKSKITEIETTFTLSGLPRTMAMKFLLIALLVASLSAKPKWSLIEVEDEAGVEDKGKTEDQNDGSETPLVEPGKKGKDYGSGDGIKPAITNSALIHELLLDGERKHKEDRKREIICRCPRGQGLPYQHRFCCSREQVRQLAKRTLG